MCTQHLKKCQKCPSFIIFLKKLGEKCFTPPCFFVLPFISLLWFFIEIGELGWRWRGRWSLLWWLVHCRRHTRYVFLLGVRELESNVDIWIQLIRKVYIDQVDRYVDITHTDVVDPYKPYGSTWSVSCTYFEFLTFI